MCSEKVRGRLLVPWFGCLGYVLDTWCLFNTLCLVSSLVTLSLHERGGVSESVICILFIGSSIETAVKLSGFTFQGYPLNLDVCK